MPSVLIVEDSEEMAFGLTINLELEGFVVTVAKSLTEATALIVPEPDLIILDLMLPDGNGLDLLYFLKQAGSHARVIVISAKTSLNDRITGLRLGADDYVSKPFSVEELLARVHANLRKHDHTRATFRLGTLVVDTRHRVALRNEAPVSFTDQEWRVLQVLIDAHGEPVSRNQMLALAWTNKTVDPKTVDVFINSIRRKIELDTREPRFIVTMIGRGYKICGMME